MDMGKLTSKQIGEMTAAGVLRAEEQLMEPQAQLGAASIISGTVPGTIKNQNLGHNSKKAGLGPNTRRK